MKAEVAGVEILDEGETAVVHLTVALSTEGMLGMLLEGGGKERLLRFMIDKIATSMDWGTRSKIPPLQHHRDRRHFGGYDEDEEGTPF